MEIVIIACAILQGFAISLGVGSSTLAIINFFVAIADGKIDETERKMMGVVYIVLRVAMVVILITTCTITGYNVTMMGPGVLTPFVYAQLSLIVILYINAVLMTMHIMPSTAGPALQAASWYTLGTLSALVPLGLTGFTYTQFVLGFVTVFTLKVALVNGLMAYLKEMKRKRVEHEAPINVPEYKN